MKIIYFTTLYSISIPLPSYSCKHVYCVPSYSCKHDVYCVPENMCIVYLIVTAVNMCVPGQGSVCLSCSSCSHRQNVLPSQGL